MQLQFEGGDFSARIPVTAAWLAKLKSLGAKDCFRGPLKEISKEITCPIWCVQLTNFGDANMLKDIGNIIPSVRQYKLGNSPHSPKVTRVNMYVQSWSYYPCSCLNKFAGYKALDCGQIQEDGCKRPLFTRCDVEGRITPLHP